jgi:hypothetical protein
LFELFSIIDGVFVLLAEVVPSLDLLVLGCVLNERLTVGVDDDV